MKDFSKLTTEELNRMDKHVLITIIVSLQQQLNTISAQLDFLTEQIALMNQRSFGRKTEQIEGQITCANFIPLYTKGQRCTVDIWVDPADMDDLEAELYDYIGEGITRNPQPVTVNGLDGYDAFYESNTELFYELRLDVSNYGFTDADGYDASRIRVVVHCDKESDIHAVVDGELVQAVINGIMVE